jgi:hypothetical protein
MRIIINESQFINLFEAATFNDIYTKYYSKIPQDIFNQIISADPTYNSNKPDKMGKYGQKVKINMYDSSEEVVEGEDN